ncbi:MAG: imidazole glycerol phosphate synthase subunit HisH [Pseudomonadota bacterium]
MSRIAIINYEAGNLTSVERAVRALGFPAEITQDPQTILGADKVIFPGVGAAGSAMADVKRLGLDQVIREVRDKGVPLLGICLGTQVIFDFSVEDGGTACLGLLPGRVERFRSDMSEQGFRLKVPHMGWNRVTFTREHPVFQGGTPDQEFYFVHSYYPVPAEESSAAGLTTYGITFASVIARDNLIATQFHLEKSGRPGLNILRNFCQWDGKNA